MQVQRINITLPTEVANNLKRTVSSGKRSKFIAKAITEKLEQKKGAKTLLRESLRKHKEFYKKEYEVWKGIEVEGWPD
jgi:metal-responsive CopG/Arc/MetJ family transcriptional regulator